MCPSTQLRSALSSQKAERPWWGVFGNWQRFCLASIVKILSSETIFFFFFLHICFLKVNLQRGFPALLQIIGEKFNVVLFLEWPWSWVPSSYSRYALLEKEGDWVLFELGGGMWNVGSTEKAQNFGIYLYSYKSGSLWVSIQCWY